MKNLRLTFGVAALAIGSFAAFSFAPVSSETKAALQEFYVNPDGSRGEPVVGNSDCKNDNSDICSQEYNTSTGEPTENQELIQTGTRP